MKNPRKKYKKIKNEISEIKNISESKMNMLYFNNWQEYIFNSVSEDVKRENINLFDNSICQQGLSKT